MVILTRNIDLRRWKKLGDWKLVYGRRKTGKTFFVKNFTEWDEYFFVRRDGVVIDEDGKMLTYDTFFEIFKRILGKERVVVDEFHRLPPEFLDFLHYTGEKGELILISSMLWSINKLFKLGSPILGLFSEFRFSLVDERDAIISLLKHLKGKDLIEASTYLGEPWLASKFRKPVREFLASVFHESRLTVPRLIGEIFREEERELSVVYESIMRAISDGKNKTTEIADVLYSRKVIPKNDPGYLHTYLKNLVNMGLMEKVPVVNARKFHYNHSSPVFDAYCYLDEKYTFSEVEISEEQVKKVVDELIPKHVEQFFRNLLAKLFGLQKGVIITKEFDVDIALTDFKQIKVVAEVKWKNTVKRNEISKIEDNLSKFDARRILIVPREDVLERMPENTEVWDVERVVQEVTKAESDAQFTSQCKSRLPPL